MELPTVYAEFQAGLEAMGQREWPAVKAKLGDPDVRLLFKDYVKAWLERQRADEELEEHTGYGGPNTQRLVQCWAEQKRLMRNCRFTKWIEVQTYRDLSIAVYGEENVYWEAEDHEDSDDEDYNTN